MQFIFVVKGQGASVPQVLSSDRLFVAASRETAHRTRHARDRDRKRFGVVAPAPGAPLQLSASRLRDLCWSESPLSTTLSLEKDDLSFHCALAQTPYALPASDAELEPVPLRIIAADELDHVFFNVSEDLLQDGRLCVFTYAENLLSVGIDADAWAEARVASAGGGAAGGAPSAGQAGDAAGGAATTTAAGAGSSPGATDGAGAVGPGGKRPRREDEAPGRPSSSSPSSRRLDSPHTPRSLFKKEQVLAVVPSTVDSDDIRELNELMDQGRLANLAPALTDFFCCQCFHLPLLTLTMSCCGAVLCERCAPTPPTVEGVSAADRACPVCTEEPLEPPLSHPRRDEKVAKLVKELKVLYHPQLRALRASRQASAEPSAPSTPQFFMPNAPVLGPR